jgi:uncharacterized protein (TIGR02300 family)
MATGADSNVPVRNKSEIAMPKEEWGTKRICPTTGRRFYDLNASPIVSPYTGDEVVLETGKNGRTMVADKADKDAKAAEAAEAQTDDDEVVLDDDSDDADDADVDLGDDVLDDDDDNDDVSLDEIADVASNDDD